MSEHSVIVTGATSTPELPASHPPTPKFLSLAMTARQNEQGDRISAVDRRLEGHDARLAGLDSRLKTCADATAAARAAAEQAAERADREVPAPDHTRADVALATAVIALVAALVALALTSWSF